MMGFLDREQNYDSFYKKKDDLGDILNASGMYVKDALKDQGRMMKEDPFQYFAGFGGVSGSLEMEAGELMKNLSTKMELEKMLKSSKARQFAEDQGQAILDEMESLGRTQTHAIEEFFKNTYNKISEPTRKKVENYIERLWGFEKGQFKPGETVIGTTKDGSSIVANSHHDLAKSFHGDDVNSLEGSERGLIAIMEGANKMVKHNPLK